MSRAALLPYPGDPFLLNYWLKFFDEVWGNEVDKLYIGLNSPIEKPVVDYIKSLCDARPKIVLHYSPTQDDHGPTINKLLDLCEEDLVMLIEDDGFIFKKGVVNSCFEILEQGRAQIVGSKRGSCSPEILEAAAKKWGLNYDGPGDQGCNFWPNFFFCSKELLLKTDRNFSAKAWKQGERIEPLDHTVQSELVNGDTMVWTSLQLRAIVPESEIWYMPQYHGHPQDLEHANQGLWLFDGKAPWTHVGSLSSGINVGGLLRDDHNRPLAQRLTMEPEPQTILPVQYCQSEMEHREFERRVQWWKTFHEYFRDNMPYNIPNFDEMRNFGILYGQAVEQIINQFGLSINEINKRQKVYKELMGI